MSPAVFILAAGFAALGGQTSGQCQPTFVVASEKPRQVDIVGAGVRWSLHVLLIGCRSDLEPLTDADRVKAAQVVEDVFKKEDLTLLGRTKKREFRDDLAKKINAALGRQAVWDVAFLHANRSG